MGRVLQPFEYFEPVTVPEALSLAAPKGAKLLAGGCDLVPSMRAGTLRASRVVSLMKVRGLDALRLDAEAGLHLGALVTIRQCANLAGLSSRWGALYDAIELVQPHIRNMGTLVGNVCSAVPFLDIPVALAALRAEIRITNGTNERALAVDTFYTAPGTTALNAGELVSSIVLPPVPPNAASAYLRINKARRREADLQKVSAACYVALDSSAETVVDSVVVAGCCGFGPLPIPEAAAALNGAPANSASYALAADIAGGALAPMTDAPWVEEMRKALARTLVRDALERAAGRARARPGVNGNESGRSQ